MWARLLLLVIAGCVAAAIKDDSVFQSHLRKEVSLDHEQLMASHEAFTHARELLGAITDKQTTFTVRETIATKGKALNLAEYRELNPNGNAYDTKTVYIFSSQASHDNIISLDADSFGDNAIRELNKDSLLYCGNAVDFKEDRVLVGSSEGSWYAESRKLSTAGLLPAHASKPSITLVRRVVSTEASSSDSKCTLVHTSALSPLELFSSMQIESLASHPYSTVFFPESPEAKTARDLQAAGGGLTVGYGNVKVDPPLVSCATSTYQSGFYSISHSKYEALGMTSGCSEFNTLSPGFNLNYDSVGHTAVQRSIDLSAGYASGLNCYDCYAFMGNAILVIVNYKLPKLMFEVKVSGGAGVNLFIDFKNPLIKKAWSKTLMPAQSAFTTTNLGSGMSFQYRFGGVFADVTGSGQATGEARMVGGATGQIQMGALFDGSSVYGKADNFRQFVSPSYNGGLKQFSTTAKFAAAVDLSGEMDFAVSHGSLFSANGSFSIIGALSIDYSLGAESALSVAVLDAASTSTDLVTRVRAGLSSLVDSAIRTLRAAPAPATTTATTTATANEITPGSTLPLRASYTGFNPDEDLVFTWSLVAPSGMEYLIFETHARSHSSGNGHVDAKWRVPWDQRFAGRGHARVNVRCSNLRSRQSSTAPFMWNHYSHDQSIFSSPMDGQQYPVNSPVPVSWDHKALKYWQPQQGSRYRGTEMQAGHVRFVLHGEKKNDDGTMTNAQWPLHASTPQPNNGRASVSFPSEHAHGYDRYYLSVHANDVDSCSGWSGGHFSLAEQKHDARKKRSANGNASGNLVSKTPYPRLPRDDASLSAPSTTTTTAAERDLASLGCGPNMIQVSLSAQYQGGLSNVRVAVLGRLSDWEKQWPLTDIMAPQTMCFKPPSSSAPKPTNVQSLFNPDCNVLGVGAGKCQDTAWPCTGGSYYSGACPGKANIKCCVLSMAAKLSSGVDIKCSLSAGQSCNDLPPACRPSCIAANTGNYGQCTTGTGKKGTCLSTSKVCSGSSYAGYCGGDLQCCVTGK